MQHRTTNKCLPDASPITICSTVDPILKELLDIPKIQEKIGGYLECFWCEDGQIVNEIVSRRFTDSAATGKGKVEIVIRKQQCGCKGTLNVSIIDNNVILETPIYPIPFRKKGIIEVGVDEVGRGSLFGPVTSGAVIWPPDLDNETSRRLIRDSKKLTEPQREEAYAYIIENAISWGVESLDNKEIDRTNILRASIRSMHMAIDSTYIIPDHIIADGNSFNVYNNIKGDPVNHTTIVEGDNKYYSIAAASIIAKVTRDRAMVQLEKENPYLAKYGIASNKGYGAKIHMEAIKLHGLTEWHRRSFGPCKF